MIINILHFSDLHFTSDDTKLQNLRNKALEQLEDKDIDFIVFSGDLLYKPSKEEFKKVKDEFIFPLLSKINLDVNKIFFTIGNHDVDLNKRDDVVFDGLKMQIIEKKNKKVISDIINRTRKIKEVEDYLSFLKDLNQESLIESNPLYTINKIGIKGISIGYVAMNTSIFMEGSSKDYGNLYLYEDSLIQAYNKIKECSIKILNLHHPLDWLQNKKEIEKLVLDKFNIVFFGHEHQHDGYHITDIYNKDIVSLNATSFYHLKNEKNGFSIYKYYIDEYKLVTEKNEFNKQHNTFETIQLAPIENINLMKKAPKAIRNKHFCSVIYPNLKKYVNKYLAINLTSEKNNHDIENIYAHPKIVEKTDEKEKDRKDEKELSLNDIIKYERNIIIEGKKESGKSTVLNMLNIQCLKNINDYIPINISGIELCKEANIDIFIIKISEYLNNFYDDKKKLDIKIIKKMIEEKRFLFFIDDIQSIYSSLLQDIIELDNLIIGSFTIKEYDIQDENLLNSDPDKFIKDNFIKLSIKPLRKKDKKALTHNIVPKEIENKISNKVIKTINKLKLPSNPFITTLLSWMYVEKIDIRENEPQIIDVFLDYLLEKADLSKTFNGKIDFNDKKDILSAIAYTYFFNNSLAIEENKILKTIIEYSEKHFAFNIDAKDILDYVYKRKILIRNNNLVQFSYRVFYYYFITLYMISNKDFYLLVKNNKNYIINMIDELKYYSALKRDDVNFLEKINDYMKENRMQKYFKKLPIIEQETINFIGDSNVIDDNDIDEKNNIIPEKKRIEFQDTIDEIETDTREKKVENYNQEKVLEINKLKSIKEEFFILNMIYSEFVKQLSGTSIDKNNKEKYFLNAISNYINIIRYWEGIFNKDKLLIKFFQFKFPDEQDISDEELINFKEFVKINVLNMISYIADITLSTSKMEHFYNNLLKKEDSNIYEKFFTLIFFIDNISENEDILQLISSFIHYNKNNILNILLKIKLYNIVGGNRINLKLQKNIKKILIQLEYKTNNLSDDKIGRNRKKVIEQVERNIEIAKLLV
jgi:predicted phosphodiesterase